MNKLFKTKQNSFILKIGESENYLKVVIRVRFFPTIKAINKNIIEVKI